MKRIILSVIIAVCVVWFSQAQVPGIYPAMIDVTAGSNVSVLPLSQPANVTGAVAYSNGRFKGLLHVSPVTGQVTVTNARPAGTYFITVRVFNGALSATSDFILTVNDPVCSQGLFTAHPGIPVGNLPFSLAIGDFNNDGKQDIATANYGFNNISIRLGNGSGGFTGSANIPAGINPQSIAIGDFNSDGKQDLAVANFGGSNVTILTGDGTGGFSATGSVVVGSFPYSIATDDLNGDGKLDLATADYGNNAVSIRMGNGNGGFSGTSSVPVQAGPRSIVISDLNNDGKADLVVGCYNSNTVSIRLNDGLGGFGGTMEVGVGNNPFSIVVDDFNSDGITDLATANYTAGSISVRLGNVTGGFGGTGELMVGDNPRSIISGDFNGDGKPDLATANINSNNVSICLGDGVGTFAAVSQVTVGNNPFFVAMGDFNADGKQDVATANAGSNDISVRLGNENNIQVTGNNILIADGDNTASSTDHTDFGNVSSNQSHQFTIQNPGAVALLVKDIFPGGADSALFSISGIALPASIPAGGMASFTINFIPTSPGVKSARVNILSDHCEKRLYDFAVAGTGLSLTQPALGVYPNSIVSAAGGNMVVIPSAPPLNTTNITAFTSTNYKGQLLVDPLTGVVSVINAHPAGTYNITVKTNGVLTAMANFILTVSNAVCSQGLFSGAVSSLTGPGTLSAVIGDFNGDGNQDIATANSTGISVYQGDGAGNFNTAAVAVTGTGAYSMVTGDLNADGRADLATANGNSNNVSIFLGNGAGGFATNTNIPIGGNPQSIALCDLNADGKPDLATANAGSNAVSIRLGDGLGGFSGSLNIPVGVNPTSVLLGDFNTDGMQDIIAVNRGSSNISVCFGNGTGNFPAAANSIAVGNDPHAAVTGDFNADGKQDLAIAYGNANVSILLGDGAGNFAVTADIAIGAGPRSVITGDFNGDGKLDIATANNIGNSVSVRMGNGSGSFIGTMNIPVAPGSMLLLTGDFNADGLQDIATAGSNGGSVLPGNLNDINVQGNSIDIADADNSAVAADGTDFGNVSTQLSHIFSIQNTGAVNLAIANIGMTGADAALFSISGINLPLVLQPGGSVSFSISFTPASVGIKTATVNIMSDDCDEAIYDFAVQGNGFVLVPVLGTYPAVNMVATSGNISIAPSMAPVNTSSMSASVSANFKGLVRVDPATGIVHIINAQPAGDYLVTVKVNGISTASTSFGLTVKIASCTKGIFQSPPDVSVGSMPFSVAIGDFNNDGRQDLVSANYGAGTASIRLGDGTGEFTGNATVSVGSTPFSVAINDFNGDGWEDIATANYNSNNVTIRFGTGDGGFNGTRNISVDPFPTHVCTGDFNGDGNPDLAVSSSGNNVVSIRFGDGTGNFSGTGNIAVGSGPYSITVADFNGDGKHDIASANYNISNVSFHLGDGLGGFNGHTNITVGMNPYSIAAGDFNADGKQDIATANYGNNTVSIRLGDGAGNFSGTSDLLVGAGPGFIVISDFNGDSKQDFAVASYNMNLVSIRLGDGAGAFNGSINIPVGTGPESIAVGDFNEDGKQDVAIANNGSNNLSVRLGIDNEISVRGNNIVIASGDSIPDMLDNTDFGIANNVTHNFSIYNSGESNLAISNLAMDGTHASLFTISGISLPMVIPPGGSAGFAIHFMPTTAGVKTAKLIIGNDDCDEGGYNFVLKGAFACPPVTISFSGLQPFYCANGPQVTLTGNPAAGVFSGPGVAGTVNGIAIFDPVVAGPGGPHTIMYTYTDGINGCSYNSAQSVIVHAIPVLSFTGLATDYCSRDAVVMLVGNQPGPGSNFTGPGITNNGNGTAGFDPAIAGGGSHTILYSYTDIITGCTTSIAQQVLVTVCPVTVTINLRLYLQGYYSFGNTMSPVLTNQLVPLSLPDETDTVIVELHDPFSFALVDSKPAVLYTNGLISVTFTQPEAAYYIAIRHRNSIQTWTAEPVDCLFATPLYDFSSAANRAFGDNQVEVEPGVWALFAGDLNQDEYIDGNDFPEYDTDSSNGVSSEYKATDMNGDGYVDGNDFPVYDLNSSNGLSSIHP